MSFRHWKLRHDVDFCVAWADDMLTQEQGIMITDREYRYFRTSVIYPKLANIGLLRTSTGMVTPPCSIL